LRLVTWNINSVRLRLPLLLRLIEEQQPDVICLQETKTVNETFPMAALAEQGYVHTNVHGMKGYNGVAILSRLPLSDPGTPDWCERRDCRHAHALLPGGIELHNLYIPAGGDIPDPAQNEKFAHKLRFLDEITDWLARTYTPDRPMILVGDLNIAPLEHDVWSHKQLLDVVSHTPVEVERMARLQESLGWIDVMRNFVPPDQKLYTWWSYRSADWAASDRGRRLDHIWKTPALKGTARNMIVLKEARSWQQPSDHVPVIIDFDV